jgi:predicted ester cyclase
VTPFYRDCLTVNASCNPAEVLERLLADDFLSIGVPNKSKQALMGQVQFFWKLIPDLKWEIQELFVDGNKVVVRSLASGSPRGDFMGLTGLDGSKSFHVTTIDIHTVENGRLKVVNHLEDWIIAKDQLSALTSEYPVR